MQNLIFNLTFTSKLYSYILRQYFTCEREDGCDVEMGTMWKKLIVASFKVLYHHFRIGIEPNHEKIRIAGFQALKGNGTHGKWNTKAIHSTTTFRMLFLHIRVLSFQFALWIFVSIYVLYETGVL